MKRSIKNWIKKKVESVNWNENIQKKKEQMKKVSKSVRIKNKTQIETLAWGVWKRMMNLRERG